MRVLVQRSLNSSVSVNGKLISKIDKGMVIFVGFKKTDTINDIKYCAKKISKLRIFDDENGNINLDINDGEILSISQFTLYGDVNSGNRPSFINAMGYDDAEKMYKLFNEELRNYGVTVKEGIFGADMKVNIINDGPITIWIESDLNVKE